MKPKDFLKIKKADSKLLSIWWFAVIVIVALGIVIGALIFFSSKIDVRNLEAEIILNRVVACLGEDGYLASEFLEDSGKFYDFCNFDKAVVEKGGNYFIKITTTKISPKKEPSVSKIFGNSALEPDCAIGSSMLEARYYVRCTNKTFSLIDLNNNRYNLQILAGSNQEYRPQESKS